jgi:hypothetical protein
MRILPHNPKAINDGRLLCGVSNFVISLIVFSICYWTQVDALGQTSKGIVLSAEPSANTPVQSKKVGPTLESISGHVVTADGQPLPQARVSMFQYGSGGSRIVASVGSDGAFKRDNMVPGLYLVSPYAAGYVLESDPQSTDEPVFYRPGDVITFRMIKGSVITGNVMDINGRPVVSAPVRVTRLRSLEGKVFPNPQVVERVTDDRGIYRMYGLARGVYNISAGGARRFGFTANAYDRDVPIYYPSSTREGAAEVTVHSGEEMTNIDIRYRSERGHVLSGTVISPGESSNSYSSISLSMLSLPGGSMDPITNLPFSNSESNHPFEITGVADGEYILNASRYSAVNPIAGFAKITVKGADVSGITLKLSAMPAIEGNLLVQQADSEQCRKTKGVGPKDFWVRAKVDRSDNASQVMIPNFGNLGGAVPDVKGDFKITGLNSGTYHIQIRFPSEQWFLRSIDTGQTSAAQNRTDAKPAAHSGLSVDGLVLSSGARKTGVTITVTAGGGSVRGRVEPELKGGAIRGRVLVTVVPTEVEKQKDVLRYAETFMNSDRTFELKNLAPGSYHILAQPVPKVAFADPNRSLSFYSSKGRNELVRTATAAKTALEIKTCQAISDFVVHPIIAPK